MTNITAQKPAAPATKPAAPLPAERTLPWWAQKLRWPAWLLSGCQVGRPVNQEFTEAEAESLAEQVAGMPLGRG